MLFVSAPGKSMALNDWITIEVAYAMPKKQVILSLEVKADSTLEEAIQQSGILEHFPELDLKQQTVGVFSQPKELSEKAEEGNRIEIYRPLTLDPKEARR